MINTFRISAFSPSINKSPHTLLLSQFARPDEEDRNISYSFCVSAAAILENRNRGVAQMRSPLQSLLTLGAVVAVAAAASSPGLIRHKRFTDQSCRMDPDNDESSVVEEGDSLTLECSFDDDVYTCLWTHNEPMNEERGGDFDLTCSAGAGENGQSCESDGRVTYSFSGNKCGITISNSKPEDTGKWKLTGVGISNTQTGQVMSVNNRRSLFLDVVFD